MGVKRYLDSSIWQEPEIIENFSPEDKLFWLYLITNSHTNLCGIARISMKTIAYELGYSIDVISTLIKRFKDVYNKIDHNEETNEILIISFFKYNWTKSDKIRLSLEKNLNEIKCIKFKNYIQELIKKIFIDGIDLHTLSIGYRYLSISISISNSNNIYLEDNNSLVDNKYLDNEYLEIIEYLNIRSNKEFKLNDKIKNLLMEKMEKGFTIEDFKKVIRTKANEWNNTEFAKHLNPETLFGNKMEKYLNENSIEQDEILKFQDDL